MADSGLYAGRLGRQVAQEIYPSMDMSTAGSFNPPGKAEKVDRGYRLSGRWRFGTGIRNADRVLGRFQRYIEGEPQVDADGQPDLWVAWFPANSVTRHDTWHTTGLAGSGSCDYSIEGVVVPAAHMYRYAEQFHPSQQLPPLSRYYGTLTGNQVGVPLGIARHALDDLRASLMTSKTKWGATMKAQQYVQVRYARAHGLYRAARAYALRTFAEISDWLFAGDPLTPELQADMQTAPVLACEMCRASLDIVMDLVGATSILKSKPFDRMYRDMSTLSRHFYFRDIHLELSGKHLLDEPIDLSLSD
jgi:alkylation response protein AidB-like acyl-CoA dehydrogenase